MKNIMLQRLEIRNFKGIVNFLFTPGCADATIYGTNAAGKTTIVDALLWAVTGKDSTGAALFGIKPVGLAPCPDIEVVATFEAGSGSLEIKKVQSEKYTKKRGSAESEFTGNEVAYFVNGVPTKQRGFEDKLTDFFGSAGREYDIIRMLNCPRHTSEEMTWQNRRKLLTEMCGEVSDADIVAANPEFRQILTILDGKTLEEYKSELTHKKKAINNELAAIPVRIDEQKKTLPPDALDAGPLTTEKAGIESRLSDLRGQLSAIESGGSAGAKKSELLDVRNKIREIVQDIRKKHDEESTRLRGVARFCQEAYDGVEKKLIVLKLDLAALDKKVVARDAQIAEMKAAWFARDKQAFEADGICPTCGQMIPEEKLEAARAEFNQTKAADLAKINADGKILKAQKEENEEARAKLVEEIKALEAKIPALKADLDAANEKAAIGPGTDTMTPEHSALVDRANAIEAEISDIAMGSHDETAPIATEISGLEAQLSTINASLGAVEAAKTASARIAELEADLKRYAKEWEALEAVLFLIEDFTRAKCEAITEAVNRKFKLVRWSLFENQINGGLRDICVATVGGVQYSDLNNAMKINAGIDIINALGRFYNVRLPVFVDNSESIVEITPTDCQVIRLVVSEADKTLRVEIEALKKAA